MTTSLLPELPGVLPERAEKIRRAWIASVGEEVAVRILAGIGPLYNPEFKNMPTTEPDALQVDRDLGWLNCQGFYTVSIESLNCDCTPMSEISTLGDIVTASFLAPRENTQSSHDISHLLMVSLGETQRVRLWLSCQVQRQPSWFQRIVSRMSPAPKVNIMKEHEHLVRSLTISAEKAWSRECSLFEVIEHIRWWNLWATMLSFAILTSEGIHVPNLDPVLLRLRGSYIPLGLDSDHAAVYLAL